MVLEVQTTQVGPTTARRSIPWMVQRPKMMKAPIGPDVVQQEPAVPHRERGRRKERRQDVAKRPLLKIRGRGKQRRQA